tara:strand:- start:883 stop:1527 length:645 start_codon:yes stop_codon:yes gene_type:complete
MKRLIIIIFLGCSSFLFSQNIFLNTGVNLTTYDYKNSSGGSSENVLSSNGMFYELGYSVPLDFSKRSRGWGRYSRMQFETSFTLNDYNATGGNSLDNYDWKSQYAGLRTGVEYMVFPNNTVTLSVEGSFGFETLLNGKQKIGGETFNLKDSEEFNGLFITPKFGLNAVYNVTEDVGLSGGLHFSKALSMKGESRNENLQFNNTHFSFGITIQAY